MRDQRRYFEDLEIGEEWTTPSRTLTESDIAWYAGLSGDYEEVHVSEEFARNTVFGHRIGHGLLGLIILDGLKTRTSLVTGVMTIASLGWTWDFRRPIRPGDTLRGHLRIREMRRTSRGDRGILYIQGELLNQDGEVVQQGENRMMVACRSTAATEGRPPAAGAVPRRSRPRP